MTRDLNAMFKPRPGKVLEALDHVKRNGSLVWFDGPLVEVQTLWREMQSHGYVQRNQWSGDWQLTEAGRAGRLRVNKRRHQILKTKLDNRTGM